MILEVILVFIIPIQNGVYSLKIDKVDCGIDDSPDVKEGDVEIDTYPWLGIYYYFYHGGEGEARAVTTVALIHSSFVIGCAADIGPIPKHDFRKNSRVLLGEDWTMPGRGVRNYVVHPEYDQTENTLALIQLSDRIDKHIMAPLCPPPEILRQPEFYVIKFREDYDRLEKQVIPVSHVPAKMCKDFYVAANLYAKKMRPPHVVCAVSLETNDVCVWDAGGILTSRDVWGRWLLLGVLTRGPGCGAPSRYLDMLSYYPWVHNALEQFQPLTITKIDSKSYVLRSSTASVQKYGACDDEEKINLVYREVIVLRTDNKQYQFLTYNLTILEQLELTCMTIQLVNASGSSEMMVQHFCPRKAYGPPCYTYGGSKFLVSVHIMFSDKCSFEMFVWGWKKNMTLLDIMEWKWEEGTYYEDFNLRKIEYRGQPFMTGFGFEPLDKKMWIPEYDLWTTTVFSQGQGGPAVPPKDGIIQGMGGGGAITRFPNAWITRPTDRRTRKVVTKKKKKKKKGKGGKRRRKSEDTI